MGVNLYQDVVANPPGEVLQANARMALLVSAREIRIKELEIELENRAETLRQQSLLLESLGDEVRKAKDETQGAKEELKLVVDYVGTQVYEKLLAAKKTEGAVAQMGAPGGKP
jgi:hypothetical protein